MNVVIQVYTISGKIEGFLTATNFDTKNAIITEYFIMC